MSRKRRLLKLLFFVFPAFLVLFAAMIWAVSLLWNWLMPAIFRLGTVTYWQALGLLVLSWILFRGFRGPRLSRHGWGRGMGERWGRMTPDEREEFRRGLRGRFKDMWQRWDHMDRPQREEFLRGVPRLWQEMLDRWEKMTPAERAEYVKGMGGGSSPEPGSTA